MDAQKICSESGRRGRRACLVAVFVAATLSAACGKKGPLYLPDNAGAQTKPSEPAQPAPSQPDR